MVLSPIQGEEPEGFIVVDLARAPHKVKMAMLQLDPVEHLLVDYANRNRWDPVRASLFRKPSSLGSAPKSSARHDVRWNMVGLELRFRRASGLHQLWISDSSFATQSFLSDEISDAEVMDRLCVQGLYVNALRLGMAADGVRPGELNKLPCHLCVQYLVPLMTPKAKKPNTITTLDQVADAVKYLRRTFPKDNTDLCDNFVVARQGGRSRQLRPRHDPNCNRSFGSDTVESIRKLSPQIYDDTAMAMLITHRYHCLPAWYESFLLLGTVTDARLPGLFARRRAPGTGVDAFLGHRDGLLNIYFRSHRYADAARIVFTVLQGADTFPPEHFVALVMWALSSWQMWVTY